MWPKFKRNPSVGQTVSSRSSRSKRRQGQQQERSKRGGEIQQRRELLQQRTASSLTSTPAALDTPERSNSRCRMIGVYENKRDCAKW
jgi:hypothetical protein